MTGMEIPGQPGMRKSRPGRMEGVGQDGEIWGWEWGYCKLFVYLQDMAKLWTDIVLPLAVAGTVAAQTLGVEVNRARVLRAWFPDARRDTVQVDSTHRSLDSLVKSLPDTVKHQPDSLAKARLGASHMDSIAHLSKGYLDSLIQTDSLPLAQAASLTQAAA